MSIIAKLLGGMGGQNANQTQGADQSQTQNTNQTQTTAPVDPYAALGNLWATPQESDQNSKPIPGTISLTREDVIKQAQGMNFGSLLSPEHRTAIAGGGENAVKAFEDVINNLGRALTANNTLQTAQLYNTGIGEFNKHQETALSARIDAFINKSKGAETLESQMPDLMKDPNFAAMAKAAHAQFSTKFAGQDPKMIAAATQEFLMEFANKLRPTASSKSVEQDNTDWSALLQG